jgi:hypothetical protein
MLVLETDAFDEARVLRRIVDYLEMECSDECDMVLAEAVLRELLADIGRCLPRRVTLEVSWRRDGAALLEIVELDPLANPGGVSSTANWSVMLASGMNGALSVVDDGAGGERVQVVLPIRRAGFGPIALAE